MRNAVQLQHQPVLLSVHRKRIDPRAGGGKATGDAESAKSWEKLSETSGTTGTACTRAASLGTPNAPHAALGRTRLQHGSVQHGAALPPPGPHPSPFSLHSPDRAPHHAVGLRGSVLGRTQPCAARSPASSSRGARAHSTTHSSLCSVLCWYTSLEQ